MGNSLNDAFNSSGYTSSLIIWISQIMEENSVRMLKNSLNV